MVLLLPDGEPDSRRRPSTLSYAVQLPFARTLARAGQEDGLAVHVVHYRCRGWNDGADPVTDARWAADEVVRRYGDVPVCLVGHGTGAGRRCGRAVTRPSPPCWRWPPGCRTPARRSPSR